jgi:3-keto-5-aminohexanoate cleavage enzyme
MDGLILNLAPTGMVPTKSMNPNVPVTPEEIVEDCCRCADLGASILHVHARDEAGAPTYRREVYARIIGGIRERKPEAIICVSLSGRNFPEIEKRSEPLLLSGDLKPDMASLTLSSLNFLRQESVNAPETIQRLAGAMAEAGVRPELEVFDLGMMNFANYLIDKGLLTPPHYFNFMLGNIASCQTDPLHLGALIASLPTKSYWASGGLGENQLAANTLGILHGNGVRVGLEDFIWMDKQRSVPASNVSMVERVVELSGILGRSFETPAVVRNALGLS